MISISIDSRALLKRTRELKNKLTPGGQRQFLRRVGKVLRDAVRQRFITSGDGKWAPLSPWTEAKTGRRKPLMNMRHRIHYRVTGPGGVEIYFDAPSSEWSIEDHDRGNVSPAVEDRRMAFPLRRPAAIGASGEYMVFNRRRASRTPARRIWLTKHDTKIIVDREAEAFYAKKGLD